MATLWIIIVLGTVLPAFSLGWWMALPGRSPKGRKSNPLLFVIGGSLIEAVALALTVIAVWPPFNLFTFLLPLLFLGLLAGIIYFVRNTHPRYRRLAL